MVPHRRDEGVVPDTEKVVAHSGEVGVEAEFMLAPPRSPQVPSLPLSFDGPLGQKIIELHVWAVSEGLRGADVAALFDGLCRRLVGAGVPLWRAFAGMKALHPQGGGDGYTRRL